MTMEPLMFPLFREFSPRTWNQLIDPSRMSHMFHRLFYSHLKILKSNKPKPTSTAPTFSSHRMNETKTQRQRQRQLNGKLSLV